MNVINVFLNEIEPVQESNSNFFTVNEEFHYHKTPLLWKDSSSFDISRNELESPLHTITEDNKISQQLSAFDSMISSEESQVQVSSNIIIEEREEEDDEVSQTLMSTETAQVQI